MYIITMRDKKFKRMMKFVSKTKKTTFTSTTEQFSILATYYYITRTLTIVDVKWTTITTLV